jgi:hypothetical protein
MTLGLVLVVIIVIGALLLTIMLFGKGDADYRNAAKKNTTNLSVIYIVVILLSFIAVAVYIKWFA